MPAAEEGRGRETHLTPSFSAIAAYDDNIFFRLEEREGGGFLRFVPALHAGWHPSATLAFQAAYSFSAEVYPDYPELNRLFARHRASAGLRYRPGARTTVSLGGGFEETQTASDLFEGAGPEFGRRPARGYSATAGLDRRLTRTGTLGLDYGYRFFDYDGDPGGGSHVARIGWSQRLGEATVLSVRGGPRWTDDAVSADVSASLSGQLRRGRWGLGYSRTRYRTPLRSTETDSVGGTLTRRFGRDVEVGLSSGVLRHRSLGMERLGYQGGVTTGWRLGRWLVAHLLYRHVRQEAGLARPEADAGAWVRRNVFVVGFTAVSARRAGSVTSAGAP